MKFAAAAIAALLCATPACATSLDFTSIASGTTLANGQSVTLGDFILKNIGGQTGVFFNGADGSIAFGDDQTLTSAGSLFTLTRVGGGLFDVNSVVFALSAGASGRTDLFDYSHRIQITSDGQSTTGTTAMQGIDSLYIDLFSNAGSVGIRNFDLTPVGPSGGSGGSGVGAVPEPATWAMMLGGFGIVGFAMRRRHKPRTSVTYA
ncbi:PEPxxWA-CTERM sorting domain-containing protein [Sphingomonas sp.]|uniref:PEPxxWA-CTERM sorting domain-containing protein n=1 Tax=Sphingomonas sp. TaxID=28214 RepID=UPI001B02EE82|nr:PEPxxWA-CTERM sorting domain-containing protein [Sphingomonas sp.]MBO9712833.1 PEP-CTERM sorting domain-containing protein [Sphingomonas sp.]